MHTIHLPTALTPIRPTSPLRLARIGTAALVAALGFQAHAGVIVDVPAGFVVRSGGSVSVGTFAALDGSLGAAGSSSLGWGATVTGSVENGSPHGWFTPNLGTLPAPGSQAINLGWRETRALDPGAYGSFTSNSETQLLLSAGDYVFSNFQLGWAGQVIADTSAGDVYLNVGNALSAGSETRFGSTGPGTLYLVTGGSASFDWRSQINGRLYTLGAQSFGSETRLDGLTWAAGSISIGHASSFNYSAPITAPGAVALLVITAGLMRRRRA